MNVTYVASRWGEPTQTFVRREAAALQGAGASVCAVSLKRPVPVANGIPVKWLSAPRVVAGFLRSLVTHPVRVVGILSLVVRRSSRRNIAPQVAAAVVGIAWVGGRRLPSGHLHAQFGWVAATAAWAAATLDERPFSVYLHAFEIHERRFLDGFSGIPIRRARAVFTHCERDAVIVRERWGREAVVARLVVPEEWWEQGVRVRRGDLVVCVARLVEKKGHRVLLDALRQTRHPWHCRIIGDGPLEAELRALTAQLGLAGRVEFVGALPENEVRAALQEATVSCLASVETSSGDRDGTPVSLLESMAARAAVVSTDVGGIREMLDEVGIVVPPAEAGELALALDALADVDRRQALAELAAERVASRCTPERVAKRVLSGIAL